MYDPLHSVNTPVDHEQDTLSYWRAHPLTKRLSADPADNTKLPTRCKTLIIGAGYTGLNAALELAEQQQQGVVVIDAGSIGAGCSSRNAGFVLPASGRLSIADYTAAFGEDTARGVLDEFNNGVERVRRLVQEYQLTCDFAPARYLRIAHRPGYVAALRELAANDAPWPRTFMDQDAVKQQFPGIRHAYAALSQQPAARVHPLALVTGYARQVSALGIPVYQHCAALQVQEQANKVKVATTQGDIEAEQVLVCSNAYATRTLIAGLTGRQLPVLSSVAVTAPLSDTQLDALGLNDTDLVMDTRRLKYYYRVLPDKRLLFGGRGATTGKHAHHPKFKRALHRAMRATLPTLAEVPFAYFWSGWVSVSLDHYPRVFRYSTRILASMGYCGAGIAFASLAGQRLAQLSCDVPLPALPFYQTMPKPFPRPILSRIGQRAYYQYAQLRDRF